MSEAIAARGTGSRWGVMMLDRARARTQAATVQLPTKGGQGVLVPGGFVLTAAHCVEWSQHGGMALGDHYLEKITTQDGTTFALEVCAVEPVSDIAVLGGADGQSFYDDAEAFEAWCEETAPVPVCSADFEREVAVPVHILTHTGTWVRGRATRYGFANEGPDACVYFTVEQGIVGGTSGGPVIDDTGRLVGIVSEGEGTDDEPGLDGSMARPHLALPGWIWRRIKEEQKATV
jgi:Trypsin-like peptidase domain